MYARIGKTYEGESIAMGNYNSLIKNSLSHYSNRCEEDDNECEEELETMNNNFEKLMENV